MSELLVERDAGAGLNLRKSERTRQAILDGALEFLWSRPFREMTVSELMSTVGASRPAFYQYFKDLHDLMETLLRGLEDEIFGVTDPWFSGEGDPIVMLSESQAGLVRIGYDSGPIQAFDARPVAIALNRLDASMLIHAFGRRPRSNPEPVREALIRIWSSTLYGSINR